MDTWLDALVGGLHTILPPEVHWEGIEHLVIPSAKAPKSLLLHGFFSGSNVGDAKTSTTSKASKSIKKHRNIPYCVKAVFGLDAHY